MADSPNPFADEPDYIEDEIELEPPHSEKESTPESIPEAEGITLDNVAAKLIKDKFILTALELHTELVESGRELPRLRDFFSNPANFERTKLPEASSPGLPRTSSCQTFDSLDFARYSDDGDRQDNDKLAVLEFELRKAQDTIKSLRATLTKTAETEVLTPESPGVRIEDQLVAEDPIKAYEKRALNFLVNEYMLLNEYKLSSVTFAEENENQDFEDWDDVGLNIPKPPDLLHLYRDYTQHTMPVVLSEDFGCCVNLDGPLLDQLEEKHQAAEHVKEELISQIADLEDKIARIMTENEFLSHQVKQMESQESKRLLKASTPAVSPINTPVKKSDIPVAIVTSIVPHTEEEDNEPLASELKDDSLSIEEEDRVCESVPCEAENQVSNSVACKGHDDTDSLKLTNSENGNNGEREEEMEDGVDQAELTVHRDSIDAMDSLQVEPPTELHSQSVNLTQPIQVTSYQKPAEEDQLSRYSWHPSERNMSESFRRALLNTAFHVSQDNRIVMEVSKLTDSSGEKVVLMLGRCLPHIVPNVLLAKREELIPVILCTASLHPDPKERDQLLNILFNLIKRPDAEQRQMILTGCVAFAQHVGPTRVESELLPQCWEQINHRFAERRLLVAEACGALAPYLPNEIRSSLVLSMLQQMVHEEKTEEVRESVVKSLGLLMGFIDDPDKFSQGADLLKRCLGDLSERVVGATQHIFLPAFAMWASELGKLETDLIQDYVKKLEEMVEVYQKSSNHVSSSLDRNWFSLLVRTLTELVPVLFASVLTSAPFANKTHTVPEVQPIVMSTRFPKPSSELTDLNVILGESQKMATLVHLYEDYISEEWYEPWEQFIWVAGEFIPQMLNILNGLEAISSSVVHSLSMFFYCLCRTLGRTFTITKVKPKFQTVLSIPEDQLDTQVASGRTALTKCTVPVFASGILAAFNQEEDLKQLMTFLQDLLCTLALCHAPLDSIKAAFSEISNNSDHHDMLLTVLWDGVVHTSAHVRTAAAKMFELLIKGVNETLVATRVIPALVTLASDPEISVRIATVPAFGLIMQSVTQREILDKVHMQFMTFMDDPIYKDQHALHVELIRTFSHVGPNAEPKFRDDFVLPRLAIIATNNNHMANETKKMDIAIQLFEAYSALSCCFISDQLISESMLPGLRCLHKDVLQVAPDHADIVASMIKEFEDKVDTTRPADRVSSANASPGSGSPNMNSLGGLSREDMKTKMFNRLREGRSGFSNIFKKQ